MGGKKDLLASALRYSGANRLLQATGSWSGLVVFNYHRIGNPRSSLFDHGVWSATVEDFEAQLSQIRSQCDVIGIDDLESALLDTNGRYAMITFDDGYRDNFDLALPVLVRQGLPALFCITTGFIDDRRIAWWDDIAWMVRTSLRPGLPAGPWNLEPVTFDEPLRESAIRRLLAVYKQLPGEETESFLDFVAEATGSGRCPSAPEDSTWMTWDQIREMRAQGMDIAGHTVTHPILARLSREQQWQEVSRCKLRLEAELGEPIAAFSYPVGAPDCFDEETRTALERCGYQWAFSFSGGYTRAAEADRYNLPRVAVYPGLSLTRIDALLTLPQVFSVA